MLVLERRIGDKALAPISGCSQYFAIARRVPQELVHLRASRAVALARNRDRALMRASGELVWIFLCLPEEPAGG